MEGAILYSNFETLMEKLIYSAHSGSMENQVENILRRKEQSRIE